MMVPVEAVNALARRGYEAARDADREAARRYLGAALPSGRRHAVPILLGILEEFYYDDEMDDDARVLRDRLISLL